MANIESSITGAHSKLCAITAARIPMVWKAVKPDPPSRSRARCTATRTGPPGQMGGDYAGARAGSTCRRPGSCPAPSRRLCADSAVKERVSAYGLSFLGRWGWWMECEICAGDWNDGIADAARRHVFAGGTYTRVTPSDATLKNSEAYPAYVRDAPIRNTASAPF